MAQETYYVILDDIITTELGKMFQALLFEAETSPDCETRTHGEWLRERLNEKIDQHARSYH